MGHAFQRTTFVAAATMFIGLAPGASAQSAPPGAGDAEAGAQASNAEASAREGVSKAGAEEDSKDESPPATATSEPVPLEPASTEVSNWQWALLQRVKLTSLWMPDKLPAEVDPLWTELEYRPRARLDYASRMQLIAEPLLRAASSWEHRDPSDGRFAPFADRQRALLKELLVRFASAKVDVAAGWQIFNWGKGDGVKPLDILQVRDYTDRLRDELLGTPSLSITVEHSDWSAELVWIPVRAYSIVPYSSRNVWAVIPREVGLPWQLSGTTPGEMHWDKDKGEAAARISYAGEGFDLALIGSLGRDHTPSVFTLRLVQDDPSAGPTLAFAPTFSRFEMLGAAAALVHESNILRLDLGAFHYADDGKNPYVKSGIRGVLGYERQIGFADGAAELRAIFEYAYDSTTARPFGSSDGWMSSPFRLFRHALLGSISLDIRQRVSVQAKGFADLVRGAWISRVSLSYKPRDGQCLWLGADLLDGPKDSPVGYVAGADRLLAGLEFTTQ